MRAGLYPKRSTCRLASWPFQLKIAQEPGFDFQWEFGFDFERYDCAGLIHRNKERLANEKVSDE